MHERRQQVRVSSVNWNILGRVIWVNQARPDTALISFAIVNKQIISQTSFINSFRLWRNMESKNRISVHTIYLSLSFLIPRHTVTLPRATVSIRLRVVRRGERERKANCFHINYWATDCSALECKWWVIDFALIPATPVLILAVAAHRLLPIKNNQQSALYQQNPRNPLSPLMNFHFNLRVRRKHYRCSTPNERYRVRRIMQRLYRSKLAICDGNLWEKSAVDWWGSGENLSRVHNHRFGTVKRTFHVAHRARFVN